MLNIILIATLMLDPTNSTSQNVDLIPPDVQAKPHMTEIHGRTLVDPYFWLRDKENPDVIAYLKAENEYTRNRTADLDELTDLLYTEMLGRIQEDDASVPHPHGPYMYSSKTVQGQSYPIRIRTQREGGSEQVVLDINKLSEGHDFTKVTNAQVSPDHQKLAYIIDHSGYERCQMIVVDLNTGEVIDDSVTDISPWGLAWANDNQTIFYERLDETNRSDRIFRHQVGSNPNEDVLLLEEPDGRFSMSVGRSRSGDAILARAESSETSHWWTLDANDATTAFTNVQPRQTGSEYDIDHGGGYIYKRTNEDDAQNFMVQRRSTSTPGEWETVIAHDPEVYVTDINVFDNYLVLSERRGGYSRLRVVDLTNGSSHQIPAQERVSTLGMNVNKEFHTDVLRYNYESPTQPEKVMETRLDGTGKAKTLKIQPVRGGHDAASYVTHRIEAKSPDGTMIPISLVCKKGVEPDGDNPCLLYGYGSYGASMDPYFSSVILSLLDRGVVYAVAHIRGGGEMGRHWYEQAKYQNKPNTFTDFIAAAETLIETGWASPNRLAIRGASAGGLLIGNVINQRPDLFAVAHAGVPFVDVINTMLDPSIPLTEMEYEEWGNPQQEQYFESMLSYSPYDNVHPQAYPALLITAGLNDPRVPYWEAAKWTAKLRDQSVSDDVILLKTNMGAGHGGASGRYERLREVAFEYAFILDHLGIGKDSKEIQ